MITRCSFALVLVAGVNSVTFAQSGFNSRRDSYAFSILHPPAVALAGRQAVAVTTGYGFPRCAGPFADSLSSAIAQSGSLHLVDRRGARDDDRSSGGAPAAQLIVDARFTRCSADTAAVAVTNSYKDKRGAVHTWRRRIVTAHVDGSLRIVDGATSSVESLVPFSLVNADSVDALDTLPAQPDRYALLARTVAAVEVAAERLILPWNESITLTVHGDRECDLRHASDQFKAGNYDSVTYIETTQIARACGDERDHIALAKAYHNRAVAELFLNRADDALADAQKAGALWPGDLARTEIYAAQTYTAARDEQSRQDALAQQAGNAVAKTTAKRLTNADIVAMVKAKLPEDAILVKIGNSPCDFDSSTDGLVALRKAGATDRILVAVAGARCGP